MKVIITEPTQRVRIPAILKFMDHLAEAIRAFHGGARRAIWRWHRQGRQGHRWHLDSFPNNAEALGQSVNMC